MSTYETIVPAALNAQQEVIVIQGWDPVLNRFFLVIQSEDDEDTPIYSNLDDNELTANPALYQDIEYFKAKARELGFRDVIAETTWQSMVADQTRAG